VRGAAIGTAVAFAAQASWLALCLWRQTRAIAPDRTARRLLFGELGQGRDIGRLWRVTRPVFGERLAYHAGYLVYAGMIGGLGAVSMAAHQGLLGIEAVSFTIAEGLGVAAGALAANHLGAGRREDAERAVTVAMVLAATLLAGCGLLFLGLAEPLSLWLGERSSALADELRRCLPIAALTQPFIAVAIVGCSALRGAGRTQAAFGITLVGAVLIRLVFTHALSESGLAGAWWAAALDWIGQALLVVPVLWLWRRRELSHEQECSGNLSGVELR
jgi:MATE family multidrug resistance protein